MSIMSKLFCRDDIGIDLGAANMRVWISGEGLVLEEPSAVAFSTLYESKPRVLAVGAEALKLVEGKDNVAEQGTGPGCQDKEIRANAFAWAGVLESGAPLTRRLCVPVGAFPDSSDSSQHLPLRQEGASYLVWPRKAHVVSDVGIVSEMLRRCFMKAKNAGKSTLRKPRVAISAPADITDVEKRALEYAARSAGARKVWVLDEQMAAALGVGLPAREEGGCMLVDIGASTTKISVPLAAENVASATCRIGGDEMNNAIIGYMRSKHNLVIGEREAEAAKIKIGTASAPEKGLDCEIKGLDAADGRQRAVTVNSKEIREEALDRVLGRIEEAITDFLRVNVSRGLAASLKKNGVVLAGGGARLRGIDKRLAAATGLPVRAADDPEHATIRGVGVVLDKLDYLSKHAKK